jgi:hypothetical protein
MEDPDIKPASSHCHRHVKLLALTQWKISGADFMT